VSVLPVDLAPVVAASARWLSYAYPSPLPGAFQAALVELQARQAVTVAAWLRYPTPMDAELLALAGPGGTGHLDWLVGIPDDEEPAPANSWRNWVDEVSASWAATILTDSMLAARAVDGLTRRTGVVGLPARFRRLLEPDTQDQQAGVLLRHPDLVRPVVNLHRGSLVQLLDRESLSQYQDSSDAAVGGH